MHKQTLLLTILIFISAFGYSQKKVYFESELEKAISITDNQGLEIGLVSIVNETGLKPGLSFRYFNELVVTKSASVIWGAGVINSTYTNFGNSNQIKYGLQGNIFVEPRWYFDFKKRALLGKTTACNNGWFLGLPIDLFTTFINEENPLGLNLNIPVVMGFRKNLNSNLFIEFSGGFGIYTEFSSVSPFPSLRIKIAYTF